MASTDKVIKIQELINTITEKPIESLISNPNWGSINFQAANSDLELLFNLCKHLKILPVDIVPEPVADTFVSSLNQAMTTISSIKNFKIEDGNPTGTRDQIVANVKTHAEHLLTTTQGWIAFLAYQKGDVQKNIDELSKTLLNAKTILEDSKKDVLEKSGAIAEIVTAAREASASAGVGVFTSDFEGHASALDVDAKKWLRNTIICALATLFVAFTSIFLPIDKDATSAQIFQYISSKLVVLLVLLTATVWCGRIYKALMHQISVAKHRANALKTFQAFVKATSDDSTKDAVLMETTRSIFANSPSGYLDSADANSDTAGTKILEVVKSVTSGSK